MTALTTPRLRLLEKLGMRRTGRKLVNGRPLVYFVAPGVGEATGSRP